MFLVLWYLKPSHTFNFHFAPPFFCLKVTECMTGYFLWLSKFLLFFVINVSTWNWWGYTSLFILFKELISSTKRRFLISTFASLFWQLAVMFLTVFVEYFVYRYSYPENDDFSLYWVLKKISWIFVIYLNLWEVCTAAMLQSSFSSLETQIRSAGSAYVYEESNRFPLTMKVYSPKYTEEVAISPV